MRWNSFVFTGAIILAVAAPACADMRDPPKFQVDALKLQSEVADLKAQVAKLQYSLEQTQSAAIKTKNDLMQEHNQLLQTQNALNQDHMLLMQTVAELKAFKKKYDDDFIATHGGSKPPSSVGWHP